MSFSILVMMMVAFILEGCTGNNYTKLASQDSADNETIFTPPESAPSAAPNKEKISMIDIYSNLAGGGTLKNFWVTSSGDGNETIVSDGLQVVRSGRTLSFTVTPHAGYVVSHSVGGTCPAGSWTDTVYTTGIITKNCTIIFTAALGIYAYITPGLSASSIDQFLLGNDGLLLSYTSAYTASGSENFGQMIFATVNSVEYAYILDPNGAVYWCGLTPNGAFTNCATTTSAPTLGSWQPRGIAFATFNALYAYIVDPGNNVVYQCAVDMTGNFANCQQSPSPYNLPTLAPYGIAFTTSINGAQQAYITDAGSGSGFGDILMCSMNNDGSFNTCTETPSSGVPNWIPVAIAFTNINGTQYAYVADNGPGTPGHVYRCSLNNDGSLANSSCVQTPSNDALLTNWYPYYIAFQTVNETKYAYIINSSGSMIGNIYRCLLDSDGLLTDCILTPNLPPSPWQPSGIAFR